MLVCGCSGFDNLAAGVARDQKYGAELLRRDSPLAYDLCREQAVYSYLETTMGIGPHGPVLRPELFDVWYDREPAAQDDSGRPLSWRAYCRVLDRTGDVYHDAVLVVGQYAVAMEDLADADAFDGSGLESLGAGISSAAGTLSAPTAVTSAAKSVGSGASTLSRIVVGQVRTSKLKKLLVESKQAVSDVLARLVDYLDALETQRRLVVHSRQHVLTLIDARRTASGGFTPEAAGALAFDLGQGAGSHLAWIERRLAADKTLLFRIAEAQAALAVAAISDSDCAGKDAAGKLSRLTDDLKNGRPEKP